MDFNLLREYQAQCDDKILNICANNNLKFSDIKNLCQEISYQTSLSYGDAIDRVSDRLELGSTCDEILKYYNVEM